jgi:hypothetical protein
MPPEPAENPDAATPATVMTVTSSPIFLAAVDSDFRVLVQLTIVLPGENESFDTRKISNCLILSMLHNT